ncbi:MAG: tetratricopeptide repeat protein [Ferruginibacter sp.]
MLKKIFLLVSFTFIGTLLFSQQKEEAEKMVNEGIAYHDKGDYEGAVSRYDKALSLDKNNLLALAEKAFSLLSLQKYDDAIASCQKAIETHPNENSLSQVYTTYGNALDALNKTDHAIEIYDEGIKQFPDYYQLYFNKGITLSSVKKYDEALISLQQAVTLNPKHPGSNNAIARLLDIKAKKIPSLLAYCRFLVLEPQSKRAKENLANLQTVINGNVEETGKNSITININPDVLADTTKDGKPKENSFSSTELMLAMDAALDYDKKNKKKTDVEQFIRKFETVCASLKETKKDNYGFYWSFYVPYFVEMKDKNLIETFAYIAFASSETADVSKWLKSHQDEIDNFYKWSKGFVWAGQ